MKNFKNKLLIWLVLPGFIIGGFLFSPLVVSGAPTTTTTPTPTSTTPATPTAPQTIKNPPKSSKLIPDCALTRDVKGQYCDDVSDLVEFGIKVGQFLFSIIGGLAFAMFIYGGFKMILSFGNPEKFKEGKNVMVAAVVGLVIAFGAYMMIDFILDALSVTGEFRVIK
ncbi:MAG: pilin [Candidatus Magasanikbacteria bacterium]|nr:pilin [Candidatus Magasanikbacteria bacterium]